MIAARILAPVVALGLLSAAGAAPSAAAVYRSPECPVVSPDGKTVYVTDRTAESLVAVDLASQRPRGEVPLAGEPRAAAISADGKTVYVALRKGDCVALVDAATLAVGGRVAVGPWPVALALAPKTRRLYTCNQGDHSVSVIDLAAGKEVKRMPAVREPAAAALTPDESRLVVANLLPLGVGSDPSLACDVQIFDTGAMVQKTRVRLPPGSTAAMGVAVSPDGKWAYVIHALARFNLPITQLERGWVHTYALSILDLGAGTRRATVLLDDLTGGAADPWAIAVTPDGKGLWITHAGTHEVSQVDIAKLHELLEGKVPPELAQLKEGTRDNIWVRIQQDRKATALLANDLTALYIAGAIRRIPSGGNGPRGLALTPDGKPCVANYYGGNVALLDAAGKAATIPIGPQPPADAARRGEIYFHDANRCFQHWHSCASCHPNNGRVDGLPWDFMRDGIGNGKDVISLVLMNETSPHNRRATRPDPRECMRTGVTGSHLIVPAQADVEDLTAYAASLKPEPNPLRPALAEAAARGKRLFEGKAHCAPCHPAPLFTDQRMHNVGIHTANEPDGRYDTPSLVECYRTAPYFHDGRALTLRDALTKHDPGGQHGRTKDLTPQELDDLVAYLLSL